MKNFYSDDVPDFFLKPKNYHFKSKLLQTYPINYAASCGDVYTVKNLIRLGVDVNSPEEQDYTALHEAASKGYLDIVKILVKQGADIEFKNKFGKTALELAESKGETAIVQWLSEFKKKSSLLDLEKLLQRYQMEELFIGEEMSVNSISEYGEYPIHIAAKRKNKPEMICLLHNGANIDSVTDDGYYFTALHYSIGLQDFNMMRFLLNSGANFNQNVGSRYTPLDLSIMMGDKKIIFYLYSFITRDQL